MLKRKIKDGTRSVSEMAPVNKINDSKNIIDKLTQAFDESEKLDPRPIEEKSASTTKKEEKLQKKKAIVNTKFGQDRIRHARRGVSSCLIGLLGIFILCGLITSAFQSYGDAPEAVGGLAILTTIFSTIGFMNALHGFRERDKNYITCKLGILLNGGIIFIFFLLYMRGLG